MFGGAITDSFLLIFRIVPIQASLGFHLVAKKLGHPEQVVEVALLKISMG